MATIEDGLSAVEGGTSGTSCSEIIIIDIPRVFPAVLKRLTTLGL